jgi:hypothetical protein
MRKFSSCTSCILFASALLLTEMTSAAEQTKDDDRMRNSGTVLQEILRNGLPSPGCRETDLDSRRADSVAQVVGPIE